MLIAIVNTVTWKFMHTVPATEVVVGFDGLNHRLDEPKANLIAAGIFGFVAARDESVAIAEYADLEGIAHPAVPKTQKAQGTYFVEDVPNGVVTELFTYVDMTAQEIKAANNDPILAQIDALERAEQLPRGLRGLLMKSCAADAAAIGMTLEQVYQVAVADPNAPDVAKAYKKFKDFDDSMAALKAKLI